MLPDAGFPASFLESSWLAPAEELPRPLPAPTLGGWGESLLLGQLSLSVCCSPLHHCIPLLLPSPWLSFGLCASGFVFFSLSAFLSLSACSSEKAMASHSSTFAWKIPWMEEPGRLQSIGSLESDTTERLHFHFLLSCIGEGNGNPLQCSCLENPRDGEA